MKKNNYHVQNGCHNCAHVIHVGDYDEGTSHYCSFRAPKRPCCGSCAMHESFSYSEKGFRRDYRAWEEWSKNREVAAPGYCNMWKHS